MGWLKCYLFGHPRLEQDGQAVVIRAQKGLALLAYLAATGRLAERETLATLLWPDYDDTRARANLRRLLYSLNQTPLAPWLRIDAHGVALVSAAGDLVDVVQFNRYLSNGSPESLAQAIELYEGEFLAGFYLVDSEPFDEWAALQRERYQRQALQAMEQLAEFHLSAGRFTRAVPYARRQLELDNLRESAWRQLMAALVGAGRRAEALAEFRRCRQLLERELGVGPAAQTVALAAAIQVGSTERELNWPIAAM